MKAFWLAQHAESSTAALYLPRELIAFESYGQLQVLRGGVCLCGFTGVLSVPMNMLAPCSNNSWPSGMSRIYTPDHAHLWPVKAWVQ